MTGLPAGFLTAPIAHRALHDRAAGRVENSRAAVRAAIARGYGIEIDLQLSADGQPMVFHDHRLDRLTAETGPIHALSADALGRIRLTGGDEGIPTLTEVLALVAGQVPLLIELKDQDGMMGPNIGRLEAATVAALAGYAGPVAVMSFNPHSVAALARLAPDVPRGLTSFALDDEDAQALPEARRRQIAEIEGFDRVGACFISHDWHDLANPRVAALKARGVPVLSWTITSPAEEAKAREIADNITFERYDAALPA